MPYDLAPATFALFVLGGGYFIALGIWLFGTNTFVQSKTHTIITVQRRWMASFMVAFAAIHWPNKKTIIFWRR